MFAPRALATVSSAKSPQLDAPYVTLIHRPRMLTQRLLDATQSALLEPTWTRIPLSVHLVNRLVTPAQTKTHALLAIGLT
jgi:hypothetical protein